MQSDQFQ